jgi:hypothetical protein
MRKRRIIHFRNLVGELTDVRPLARKLSTILGRDENSGDEKLRVLPGNSGPRLLFRGGAEGVDDPDGYHPRLSTESNAEKICAALSEHLAPEAELRLMLDDGGGNLVFLSVKKNRIAEFDPFAIEATKERRDFAAGGSGGGASANLSGGVRGNMIGGGAGGGTTGGLIVISCGGGGGGKGGGGGSETHSVTREKATAEKTSEEKRKRMRATFSDEPMNEAKAKFYWPNADAAELEAYLLAKTENPLDYGEERRRFAAAFLLEMTGRNKRENES